MKTLNKTALKVLIISSILASLLGTLLHFLYDFANQNMIAGLFSAVNESVWEHLKLLFIPLLFSTVIENIIYGKYYGNFFFSRLIGILAGLFTVVSIHYTYTGVIGKRFDAVDVILYFIGVAVAYGISFIMITHHKEKKRDRLFEIISVISLAIIAAAFFVFTYYPPSLAIFQSKVQG